MKKISKLALYSAAAVALSTGLAAGSAQATHVSGGTSCTGSGGLSMPSASAWLVSQTDSRCRIIARITCGGTQFSQGGWKPMGQVSTSKCTNGAGLDGWGWSTAFAH